MVGVISVSTTLPSLPPRLTLNAIGSPFGASVTALRDVLGRRDRDAADLEQDVADLELAVRRRALGDRGDLDGRRDVVPELAQRRRDRGVLRGHHVDLALLAVLLLGGVRRVHGVVGVHRVVGVQPVGHQREQVEPRLGCRDQHGGHPELAGVAVHLVAGDLDDLLAVGLAEDVERLARLVGDVRHRPEHGPRDQRAEQQDGRQAGRGPLRHAGKPLTRPSGSGHATGGASDRHARAAVARRWPARGRRATGSSFSIAAAEPPDGLLAVDLAAALATQPRHPGHREQRHDGGRHQPEEDLHAFEGRDARGSCA